MFFVLFSSACKLLARKNEKEIYFEHEDYIAGIPPFLRGINSTMYVNSPWEFKIQATNILNTEFTNSDSFSDEYNTTTQYFVLPRIVMFMVKYDL